MRGGSREVSGILFFGIPSLRNTCWVFLLGTKQFVCWELVLHKPFCSILKLKRSLPLGEHREWQIQRVSEHGKGVHC